LKTVINRILKISRYMSFVLRHEPSALGISLNKEGWVELTEFVSKLRGKFPDVDIAMVQEIVRTDNKRRYSIKNDMIRANQGHSVDVCAIDLTPLTPPAHLYHGTTQSAWEKIKLTQAIKKMGRHHVHLSFDQETARAVSFRRSMKTVILKIEAQEMACKGYLFFRSENGIWLVDEVPLEFLTSSLP
jgi:putative RNA 2'-phosphotransferase